MDASHGDPEILAEYARRRTRRYVSMIPVMLVLLAVWYLGRHPGALPDRVGTAVVVVAVILVFGTVAFNFVNWTCPSCKSFLGRQMNPKYCRDCGARLW